MLGRSNFAKWRQHFRTAHCPGVVDMHKYVQTRTEKMRLKAAQAQGARGFPCLRVFDQLKLTLLFLDFLVSVQDAKKAAEGAAGA